MTLDKGWISRYVLAAEMPYSPSRLVSNLYFGVFYDLTCANDDYIVMGNIGHDQSPHYEGVEIKRGSRQRMLMTSRFASCR